MVIFRNRAIVVVLAHGDVGARHTLQHREHVGCKVGLLILADGGQVKSLLCPFDHDTNLGHMRDGTSILLYLRHHSSEELRGACEELRARVKGYWGTLRAAGAREGLRWRV